MFIHRRILAGLFLTAGGCGMLRAADYHVSPDGSDQNSGALESPWKTLARATSQLVAGDSLFLRTGIYQERLLLNGMGGTSGAPIVIRNLPGEKPVIDGASLTVPAGGRQGLVALRNCSHIRLQGLEVRNFGTSSANRTPVGIQIEGSGSGLKILDNKIHHIRQNSSSRSANGFGLAVYGTAATPIDGLVLKGNRIYELRTGRSESVVLNGNVTNFLVQRNHVHDCNNIGIDFIGYEGSAPAAVDRARDGVCRENLVHGIDSANNPGYGGSFDNGGGDRSAAGICIDGGTRIIVERNHVHGCNFGIELASEHAGGFTDEIEVRNNLLHHNTSAGLIMGGYDSKRGRTRNCVVRNNTLYRNDTLKTFSGQIALQFYLENNTFRNNIVRANAATGQIVIHYVEGGTAAQRAFGPGNVFDYNVYFCEGNASDIEFGLNTGGSGAGNKSLYGLSAWRAAVGSDGHSSFHDPGLAVAVPDVGSSAMDFRLSDISFCRDSGEPSPPFVPAAGEKDFFGNPRQADLRVDVGMHEFFPAPGPSDRDSSRRSDSDGRDDSLFDGFSLLFESFGE
jgi:hypothetical protein